MNSDSSVRLAVSTIRSKPDFTNMVSFSLNCLLQALAPSNSTRYENLNYLLSETFHLDLNKLISKGCEDHQMVGLCLAVLLRMIEFNSQAAEDIYNSGLTKNLLINMASFASCVEVLTSFCRQMIASLDCKADMYQVMSQLLVTAKLLPEDALNLCKMLQKYEFLPIDRTVLLQALTKQSDSQVIEQLLELLWRSTQFSKYLKYPETTTILRTVHNHFGNIKISYLAYCILSSRYKYEYLLNINKDFTNSLVYLFTLAYDSIAFSPKIYNVQYFLYTSRILAESGTLGYFFYKFLLPKTNLLTTEQHHVTFIDILKQATLKQNLKSIYEHIKSFQKKSESKIVQGQYEILLKYVNSNHDLSKIGPIIQHCFAIRYNKTLFKSFFKIILYAVATFNIQIENPTEFMTMCLNFMNYPSHLNYLVEVVNNLYDYSKDQIYQQLLLQVYQSAIVHKINMKKIRKIEKYFKTIFMDVDKCLRGFIVLPSLMESADKWSQSSYQLLKVLPYMHYRDPLTIGVKFHLLYKLLSSYNYHKNIAKVAEAVFDYTSGVLESEDDKLKEKVLGWAVFYLKKIEKNAIFIKTVAEYSVGFSLDRLFFLLVSSLKTLKCVYLYDLLFYIEHWTDLPGQLRKFQAYTILTSTLQKHSDFTTDALYLLEVTLKSPSDEFLTKLKSSKLLKNLQENMNKYKSEQLMIVYRIYGHFDKLIAINYFKEYDNLKKLIPSINQLRTQHTYLDYMLKNNQDCSDVGKIIQGGAVVLKHLATINPKTTHYLLEHEVRLLVGLLLWIDLKEHTLPNEMIESLNTMLKFPFSNSQIVYNILKVINDLPNSFNLSKLPLDYLYLHFMNNLSIVYILNDLLYVIIESKPYAISCYNLYEIIKKIITSLAYEQYSDILRYHMSFIKMCMKCDKYADFVSHRLMVLQKAVYVDLSLAHFYRTEIVEFCLDILDREEQLSDKVETILGVLLKFIDEDYICYIVTMALKDTDKELLKETIPSKILITVMMSNDDEEVRENCRELLKLYAIEDKFQKEFLNSFKKQDYANCYRLLHLVEKPHELVLSKDDLNRLLAYHAQHKSKLKDFFMTISDTASLMHYCYNLYKFDMYTEDILNFTEEQPLVEVEFKDRKVIVKAANRKINEKQVCQIVKKERVIENIIQYLRKSEFNNLNRLKLLSLYSQYDDLKGLIKLPNEVLTNPAYVSELYNFGIPLNLPEESRASTPAINLVRHLKAHMSSNEYFQQKLFEDIMLRKDKDFWIYMGLLEIVARKFEQYSEFQVNLTKKVLEDLDENNRLIRFPSTAAYYALNRLKMVGLLYLSKNGESSIVTGKTLSSSYDLCQEPSDFDVILMIVEQTVTESANPYEKKKYLLEELSKEIEYKCGNIGKYIMKKLEEIKEIPKATAVAYKIAYMKNVANYQKDSNDFPMAIAEEIKMEPTEVKIEEKSPKKYPYPILIHESPKVTTSKQYPQVTVSKQYPQTTISKPQQAEEPAKPVSSIKIEKADNLKEYSQLLDQAMEKPVDEISAKYISQAMEHILYICYNPFYCRKILKLNIIYKLILVGNKYENQYALQILHKLSRSKSKEILKEQHIIEYLKRELKKVLEKKMPRDYLRLVTTIMCNSEYEYERYYFQQGLYSVLIEIAKTNIMQLYILQFFNSINPDEKVVNELYQRGLIQQAVLSLKEKGNQSLLAEWMKLIGKICINPAIQKKLVSLNIHEAIYNLFSEAVSYEIAVSAAMSLSAISLNNPTVVQWLLSKNLLEHLLKTVKTKDGIISLCTLMYAIGYNNEEGKKAVSASGGVTYLIKAFRDESGQKFPDQKLLIQCLKALSTLSLSKENAIVVVKQKLPKTLIDLCGSAQFTDYFSYVLYTLTSITRNIESQKEYLDIKDQGIWDLLNLLKEHNLKGSEDHQNILIILYNLYRFEPRRVLDNSLYEHIFWCIINKSISDDVILMMMRVLLQTTAASKSFTFTEEIFSNLEKIALRRASDAYLTELIQLLNIANEPDYSKVMAKYKLADVACDAYRFMNRTAEGRKETLTLLEFICRQREPAKTVVSKIGGYLLESAREAPVYKILSHISSHKENIDMLLQLGILDVLNKDISSGHEIKLAFSILNNILNNKKISKEDVSRLTSSIEGAKVSPDLNQAKSELLRFMGVKDAHLTEYVKSWMVVGVLAKLYKNDGSVSELLVTLTPDCKMIKCVDKSNQSVAKPKWCLGINDINELVNYSDYDVFKKSNFYKSTFMSKPPEKYRCLSILSSRNELHICFDSKYTKAKWLNSLMAVQQHIQQMLIMFR